VIYQIYPRSFLDTGKNGIGTLAGITQKLDYVASLGVDGIWITPFYPSPMRDFGYDVSDYCDIDPLFGAMKDFTALVERAKELGLKVITDLVLSHTSDLHPWFMESRSDNMSAKSEWYVWADPDPYGGPPNNWMSIFGGPAWTFDHTRGQYYLHNFLPEQPDLNIHNPEVQDTLLDVTRFWIKRGVDGFRLDACNFYCHDLELRDNPPRTSGTQYASQLEAPDPYSEQQHVYDKSRPEAYDFLCRLNKLVESHNCFTIGELGDDHPYKLAAHYTHDRKALHTSYNPHMMSGMHKPLTSDQIIDPIEDLRAAGGNGWPSWAFSNHDVVRAASRWCPDGEGFGHDPRLSKMLIALLGCLRGTAFLYQGEELGLPEAKLNYEDLQDPWGMHLWPLWQGRDGARTPMPWHEDQKHAGFSDNPPWLPIPESHIPLSVDQQEADNNSVLAFTRGFLKWRKSQPALLSGEIEFLETPDETSLHFLRYITGQKDKATKCRFALSAPYDFSVLSESSAFSSDPSAG